MNRKQFILVLAALAIIGGAGLVLLKQHQETWSVREAKIGDKVLPHFQFNEVAAIHIKGRSELNLVRQNDLWRVRERYDYPANYSQVRNLLMRIRDLNVAMSEAVGPSQLAQVELTEPGNGSGSGTRVEFKDAQGKMLDALLLGKKHDRHQKANEPVGIHGFYDGRYVLLPADPGNVLLASDDLANATPAPQAWLSQEFVKVEKVKSISQVSADGVTLWTLLRQAESWPWTLTDSKPDETFKTNLMAQASERATFLRFADVAPNTAPAQFGLDKPLIVFIETFDGLFYTFKVGAKQPQGDYPMTVAVTANFPAQRVAAPDEQPENKTTLDNEFQARQKMLREQLSKEQALTAWVYMIEPSVIDLLIGSREQFLEKKTIVSEPSPAVQNGQTNVIN